MVTLIVPRRCTGLADVLRGSGRIFLSPTLVRVFTLQPCVFFLVLKRRAPGIARCWQICRRGLRFLTLGERTWQQQKRSGQNPPVKLASGNGENLQPWLTTGRRAAIQVSHFILDRNFSFQSLPKRSALGLALWIVVLKGNQRQPRGFPWCERRADRNGTESTGPRVKVRVLRSTGQGAGTSWCCRLQLPASI